MPEEPPAPQSPPPAQPAESVRPLERGLAVLRALAAHPGHTGEAGGASALRAGDLVKATGLARSTVDRVVATLVRLGQLRQQGQDIRLALPLMDLGNAYLAARGPTRAMTARTARLADDLDESVSLAVPDGDGVRFVAQATRRRTMSAAFRVGDLLPAERCAPGALFAAAWDDAQWESRRARAATDPLHHGFPALAPLTEPEPEAAFAARVAGARAEGHALDDQLIEPGLVAVSVPVRAADGGLLCALSVVSHTSRHTPDSLAELVLPRLRTEAGHLAAELAAPPPQSPADPDTSGPSADGGTDTNTDGGTDTDAAKSELGPGFLQSLARGLTVLRALGGAREGLALTALADATGLPRATARRCLHTLVQEGYAEHTGRAYRPLPRVLELGYARLSALTFAEIAEPHLAQLAGDLHESASVSVLDGTDILYVARVAPARIMTVHITRGTRFPAYTTSMGRVLLAGLPAQERAGILAAAPPQARTRHTVTSVDRLTALVEAVAAQGYAEVDQELEVGLRAVAVPLRDAQGRVVAALNAARHFATPGEPAPQDPLPALRATAAAIEADLYRATRFNDVRVP